MGIFDKWILAKAAKIKAEKDAAEKAKSDQAHREYAAKRELRNSAKTQLYALIKTKIKEYDESVPCELQVGDRAILNYYSLRRSGNNGWDGGPGSLLSNIPVEERKAPIVVKITKIYVDQSLADELVDKFIDNATDDELRKYLTNETLDRVYAAKMLRTRGTSRQAIGDTFGLYRTAHFEYEGSFKPRWGLNTDSFISDRYEEFQETFDIWSQEIELSQELNQAQEKINELLARKKIIMEKYHKIHYAN